jgi:hypothetical protein
MPGEDEDRMNWEIGEGSNKERTEWRDRIGQQRKSRINVG